MAISYKDFRKKYEDELRKKQREDKNKPMLLGEARENLNKSTNTLKKYVENNGITTDNNLYSAPNSFTIRNKQLKENTLLNNNAKAVSKLPKIEQQNVEKYQTAVNTDKGQKLIKKVRENRNELSKAQSNFDINQAKERYKNASKLEKAGFIISSPIRSAASMIFRNDNRVQEGKKSYNLPNYSEAFNNEVSQNSGTVGKIANDIGWQVGKLAVSSALNGIVPGLGSAAYSADMFDNSYNNALREGYSQKQATIYATIGTVTEFATQKLLGAGVGRFKGNSPFEDFIGDKLKKIISSESINKVISSMTSEGIEEFTQEYIDQLNRNLTLGEDEKIFSKERTKQALYSALIGALSGGMTQGTGNLMRNSIDAQSSQIIYDIERVNNTNLSETNKSLIYNTVFEKYLDNSVVNPKEVVDSFLKENSNYSTLSKQETDNNQLTKITDSISQNSDIQPYTNQEIENYKNGKVKIAINENDISSFIESAKKIPSNAKLYFGKISENLSNRIKQTINLDLNNYNISLKADSIRHILRKHGNNSEILRGQIPVNPEDFKLIPQIISNYDSVETSGTTNEGKPAITFSKKFGNNYYLVTYVSDKNHNLEVQTMWKQKKNPATADNTIKSPIQTSETDSGTGSSNIDNTTNISKSQNIVLPSNNMQQNENKKLKKSANSNISKDTLKITPENNSNLPKLPRIERTNKYNGESKFYDNIRDKTNMLNENQKNAILDEDEIKYYDKISNNESLEKAQERLKSKPHAIEEWFRQDSKNATSIDVAEGWILMKKYADANDTDGMVEVAKKMRDIGTKAGQTVQAFNIMERMSPEGMVKYAQTELLDAFDELSKNKTKKWIDTHRDEFELKPEDVQLIKNNMNDIKNLEDGYEKRVKLAEIQKMMTDKIPSNMGKKIKSWMRISMLFNPKTQVRNVAGNALIAPINSFSDLFSSYADKIVAKKTGIRTTGNTNIKATLKGIKKGAYESTNDFRKGINTKDMEGNRFEIGEGKSFSEKNIIGRNLNRVESLLNYVMDIGDRVFSQAAFENSLQNQMILNGTSEVTQEMLDIARTESLQRTWNDNNNYTKSVLKIREILNAGQNYGIGDILIPFAKTPANLTKAIVDYSPVGMLQTIKDGANLKKSLSNGQYDAKLQHKFVQEFGKATAGTMLYIAGIALAKAKITSGDSDDDKDVANFIKNTLGTSSYSIKIGGKSFAYDWAQPLAAPLSITANIVNKNYQNKDARKLIETIVDSLDTGSNLLLEQSFAQSIKDVLSDNDGIASGIIKEILDLPARAIPTFAKQIAELTDGTQRQTYEYNAPIKSAFNSVKAKLPGLSKTLNPSVDTMGRDIQKYGGKNNIFNVFLNPANVNTENISKSAKEIYDIYKETGDKTIMPRVAPYYLNNNEKIILTSEQRTKFQKLSGEIIEKNVQKLLNSKEYKNMDSMTKAEVIKDIVNYSYNISQKEVLDTPLSEKYEKAYEYSKIGNISDYYTFKNSIDDDNKKESISNYLTNSNLNNKQLAMLYGSYYSSEETLNNLLNMNIPIKEFIKIDSMDVKGIYNTATGKTINGSKQNEYITTVNKLKLTISQKAILIKMKYSSYKKYDNQIVNYVNSINTSVNDKKLMLTKIGFKNYYKDVVEYINSQNISKKNKEKKLKSLGFTIRDGRVYW